MGKRETIIYLVSLLAIIPLVLAGTEVTIDWIHPTTELNVTQGVLFNTTFDVGCIGGDCGEINITLDPVFGASINYTISTFDAHFNETGCITATSGLDGNDDRVATFTLGFDFPYFGETIDSEDDVYMDTNGKISFGLSTSDFTPTEAEMKINKFIAALWDDLRLVGSKHYVCTNQGTSPNRYAVFHWETAHISTSEKVEAEVVLRESGNIEINWGDIENKSGSMIVGISNGSDYNYEVLSSVNSDNSSKGWKYSTTGDAKSGIISTDSAATPFYTNKSSNPFNISLNEGESEEVVFWVNATGDINITHEFFAYANITDNVTIGNLTSIVNITIKDLPFIEFIAPTLSNGTTTTNTFIEVNVSASSFDIDTILIELFNSTGLVSSATDSASPFFHNFTLLTDDIYYLNATVNDTYNVINATETLELTTDTSIINLDWVFPTSNINATQNETFDVQVNVSCAVANCGEVNVTLDPAAQPVSCKEILDLGQSTGNGTYEIYPYGNATVTSAYCNMDTNGGGWTLVFAGKGNNAEFNSSWVGWHTIGTTTNLSTQTTEGKSPVYDYVNVSAVMLETNYSGSSLIMSDFDQTYDALIYLVGPTSPGDNNGNETWDNGLRGNFSTFGRSGNYFNNDVLKIWHGDGTTDTKDYVTFSTKITADADWNGDTDNIGGEFQTAGPNTADWYRVYIRENISYTGAKNGVLPMDATATPFYTNVTNPYNLTLNEGESEVITWTVNATGDIDTNHTFFIYANKTSNEVISNTTPTWNITIVNFTVDYELPIVTLVSPQNFSGSQENVTFSYNVTDTNNITSCNLLFDTISNQTETSITKNDVQSFTLDKIRFGSHTWGVNCTDEFDNVGASETRTFGVIPTTKYTGTTTNLSFADLSNIANYTLEESSGGKIIFNESVDLSGEINVDEYTNISFNRIELDSENLASLNKSATLSFYNLTFVDPRPLINGEDCPSTFCTEISYSGGTYILEVGGFSIYTTEETPLITSDVSTTTSPTTSSSRGGEGKQTCNSHFDCGENYFCQNKQCVKLFDIEILDIIPNPLNETKFNLKYRLKGVSVIEGDVLITFWLEKGEERIFLGKDTLYVGSFEEIIHKATLFLPQEIQEADYDLYIQVQFENYKAESFRKLSIDSLQIPSPPQETHQTTSKKEQPRPKSSLDEKYIPYLIIIFLSFVFTLASRLKRTKTSVKRKRKRKSKRHKKRKVVKRQASKRQQTKPIKEIIKGKLNKVLSLFKANPMSKKEREIIENIKLCEEYKNELISYAVELEKRYKEGEMNYYEYVETYKNLEEQIKYYDDWIMYYAYELQN